MNDAQQMAISGQHASLWSILFGNVEPLWSWREIAEATKKHMYSYAIHIIKKQPFFI